MSSHRLLVRVGNVTERESAVATATNWLAEEIGPVDVIHDVETSVPSTDQIDVTLYVMVDDSRDSEVKNTERFEYIKEL
jgi:hypothetical protein